MQFALCVSIKYSRLIIITVSFFILMVTSSRCPAYSETLKMPLWTSFTMEGPAPGTTVDQWCSDVRLNPDNTQTCGSYDVLLPLNITMYPLFPRGKYL